MKGEKRTAQYTMELMATSRPFPQMEGDLAPEHSWIAGETDFAHQAIVTTQSQSSEITHDTCAKRIAIALLVGFTVVAAFTFFDQQRRAAIERVDEPTAVGDKHFVTSERAATATPLAIWKGRPLIGSERVKVRDNRMLRAGTTDDGTLSIYRLDESAEKNKERAGKQRDVYFLKVGTDQYIKVTAQ